MSNLEQDQQPAPPTPYAPAPSSAPSVAEPPKGQNAMLAGIVAFLLILVGVVNWGFSFAFPQNAPVEVIYNFGISMTLMIAGVILAIGSRRIARRLSGDAPPKLTTLAVLGAGFSVIALLGWFIGGVGMIQALLADERLRYMEDVFGTWLFAVPLVLGIHFGTYAYRRGAGRLNTVLSIGAIVLGFVVLVPTVASAVIYAFGLSD